jgi:hypothetical protein
LRMLCIACRFRNARAHGNALQAKAEAATRDDPDLQAIALERASSDREEDVSASHSAGKARAPVQMDHVGLSSGREVESFYTSVHLAGVCGILLCAVCASGWLVALKLDQRDRGIFGDGISWSQALSPLWAWTPLLFLAIGVIQYMVFAAGCCSRSHPCSKPLRSAYSQLFALSVLVGFVLWLSLPFLGLLDKGPHEEQPTPGSPSFDLALGLLIFGVGCCACFLNPGSFNAVWVLDPNLSGSDDSDSVWVTLCAGITLFCCGGSFITSICIGVYLTSMRLTGHTASFIPDASFGLSVGVFVIGVPGLLCLFGPLGFFILWILCH